MKRVCSLIIVLVCAYNARQEYARGEEKSLRVSLDRKPGYRCGDPDPAAKFASGCIDTAFIRAEADQLWVFEDRKLAARCPGAPICVRFGSTIAMRHKLSPSYTYIIAVRGDAEPVADSVDLTMLNTADIEFHTIEVRP